MNTPIDVADLPHLDDSSFVGVSPTYLTMTAIPYRVLQVVAVLVSIIAAITISPWLLLIGALALGLLEAPPFLRRLAYPYLGYQAREHDFSVRSGLINRSVTTIPFKRIQNSVVNQGPLERKFNLSTLRISSAGGAITVPGMPMEDATKLRAFVAESASLLGDDDVDGA